MNRRRFRLLAAGLAGLAAATVFVVATELFPYHSINHDEGVYLQQAKLLLDGQFRLFPPVAEAFRPWFFVEDGAGLYPKYAPVPAAMFAVGQLLGDPRIALALIAAGNVALTAALATEAFDRRTGLLAGAFLLASPLFVVDSSVFLPYAPTTFWNLLFAFAYVRAARAESSADDSARASDGYALLAGLAVGVAFFSRPYTSVLFATPFIGHALYSLGVGFSRPRVTRLSLTALGGLAGVGAALAYNAAVTGSPWVFPYEAFAPHDGLGFGYREILGHEETYTPQLAVRANARVVRALFTDWVVGGPVGTLLAAGGVASFLARTRLRPREWSRSFTDAQARAAVAGLFVSVTVGNVYFWGNFNILGDLTAPGDGLIAALGPYYHFDLLVPTAIFAASGGLAGVDRVRSWAADVGSEDADRSRGRGLTVALALAGLLVLAGATAGALAPTVAENAETTSSYEDAYEPFEDRDLSNAVVLLPTPYGDWLNHPFQHLRNDPGYDGDVVYALDDDPHTFEVVSAFPNRTHYRYVYRGAWVPASGESVAPALQRVRSVEGQAVAANATLALPDRADRVSARLSAAGGQAYYAVEGTPENLSVALRVEGESARLVGPRVNATGGDTTVGVGDDDEVDVEIFVSNRAGTGFSYRLELPVRRADGTVRALSPRREACLEPATCGGEAAYVADAVPDDVRMTTDLRAVDGNATAT